MKKIILLILAIGTPTVAFLQPVVSELHYHGERFRAWGMPRSHAPDAEAGIGQFPNPNFNFITQFSTRFTPTTNGQLYSVDFWLDTIETGISDSTISYHGAQAVFAWPIPYNHVPQTFSKHATRFTAPADGRVKTFSLYAGAGTSSSDGFNDTLKISFLRPIQVSNLVVKYGNENASNNPTWIFYSPVGSSRTAYGVRFTTPTAVDSFRLNSIQYFVQGINDNSSLPAGSNPPNDTLRVRIYTADENDYPGEIISEMKILLSQVVEKEWNTAVFFDKDLYLQKETDFFAIFDLIAVGAPDHIGFASGTSFTTPIRRSVLLEQTSGDSQPVWRYIEESIAFKDGGAKGAELWMRALFLDPSDAALAENDPQMPNENASYGSSLKIPMTAVTPDTWNEFDVSDLGLSVQENDQIWITTELLAVGSPDKLDLISDLAESTPGFRSAAFLTDGEGGGNWRYMQNTQFGNDYTFRKRTTFSVEDGTTLSDDILVILYEDTADSLPGVFSHAKFIPIIDLNPGAWNTVDLDSWNYQVTTGVDFHLAISSEFEANEFSLATDDGTALSGEYRTSVYYPFGGGWKHIGKSHNYPEYNLLMGAVTVLFTSLEREDDLADGFVLHGNYPNPFNPSTQISFTISEDAAQNVTTAQHGHVRLAVYDLLGRETAVLADGVFAPGTHTVTFNAGSLASGMYLYRLEGYGKVLTGKMSLVK